MVAYTYSRVAALNFNTTPASVAKSATGQVYAIADTTFTTPLTVTMVVGGTAATSLSSDANGFFADFTVADRTSVVWKQNSSSFTTVLTTTDPVPGAQGSTGAPGNPGVKGDRGDLATWQTNTFYPLNQVIANPSGDLVKVTTAHTSGATYDGTKFGWVNNNAANLTGALPEATLPGRLSDTSLNATYASLANMFYDAKIRGAKGDNATDDTLILQAAIDAAVAAGGGVLYFPKGTYRISAPLAWPVNAYVRLIGQAPAHVGGPSVAVIARKVGYTGTLVKLEGTGGDAQPTQRIYGSISNLQLNGLSATGSPLLDIARASEFTLDNVHLYGNVGALLKATEWFNSHITGCFFQNGGNGRTSAAVLFDSPASGVTAAASGNTVHVTDCEWEGNTGTDLRITGNAVGHLNGQDWTLAVLVTSAKMERDTGAYPLIDLDRAGACQFVGGFFHLGPNATAPHVEQKGTAVIPARANGFTGCSFSSNTWNGTAATTGAVIQYFFDVTVGQLALSNVSMNGNPTSAYVHIGASVGINDVTLSNIPVTDRSKLLLDDRAGSQYGYGSIALIPAISDVAAIRSVNRPIWVLPDAATNTITYANVPLPADAATGRPMRVRIHWYSDAATGDIRWDAQVRDLDASGFDITTGQSDYLVTSTVPATANRTTTTMFVTGNLAKPGSNMVAVGIQRLGADAADTCLGGGRILAAELLYEKAL